MKLHFKFLHKLHGRAGRDKLSGNVIIQTYNPENFSIQCAKEQDYKKFYDTEILLRKQLKYPPFCDIIVIGFTGTDEKEVQNIGRRTYGYFNRKFKDLIKKYNINILKFMPAPISKIQNRFRYRIIIKANMSEEINQILNEYLKNIYNLNLKKVNISIDVNPNNMS